MSEFELFGMCFPFRAEKVISYRMFNDRELYIECEDGYIGLFDIVNKSLRKISKDYRNKPTPEETASYTKEDCEKEFSLMLTRALDRNDMTQTELSRQTNIPIYLINNYAKGRSLPGYYNLRKIARALNCSMNEFAYPDNN